MLAPHIVFFLALFGLSLSSVNLNIALDLLEHLIMIWGFEEMFFRFKYFGDSVIIINFIYKLLTYFISQNYSFIQF